MHETTVVSHVASVTMGGAETEADGAWNIRVGKIEHGYFESLGWWEASVEVVHQCAEGLDQALLCAGRQEGSTCFLEWTGLTCRWALLPPSRRGRGSRILSASRWERWESGSRRGVGGDVAVAGPSNRTGRLLRSRRGGSQETRRGRRLKENVCGNWGFDSLVAEQFDVFPPGKKGVLELGAVLAYCLRKEDNVGVGTDAGLMIGHGGFESRSLPCGEDVKKGGQGNKECFGELLSCWARERVPDTHGIMICKVLKESLEVTAQNG
jgi:hypothetical protein